MRPTMILLVVLGSFAAGVSAMALLGAGPPTDNRTIITDARVADILAQSCAGVIRAKLIQRQAVSGDWEAVVETSARLHSTLRTAISSAGITDEDIIERAIDADPAIMRDYIDALAERIGTDG